MWDTIVAATTGRGELRLFLQPAIAMLVGIRLGRPDGRTHVLPALLLAIGIDAFLQISTHGHVRWLAAIMVGAALIFIPYRVGRTLARP